MKTLSTTTVKSATVKSIKFVVAPVHLTLQVATNLVAAIGDATCNGIAQGEGFIIEQIDGTPREETAALRTEYTQTKMFQAAIKADELRRKLQGEANKATTAIKHTVTSIKKELVQPSDDKSPDTLAFALSTLKANKAKVIENTELSDSERNKLIASINREIAVLNKMAKLPTVSPEEAFA